MKRLSLQLKSDQRGLVSIVVVGVIVVLLTLITLGFSKVMDRELRQSLDQGLSSQAYYAAESGLNDARSYIKNIKNGSVSDYPDPKKCLPLLPPFATGGDISGNGIVKYTCVLIDMKPKELIYDVNAGNSTVFKTTTANLSSLYFSWQNRRYNDATTTPQPLGTCGSTPLSCQLPEENALVSNATGVLRVTIYPISDVQGYYDLNNPNPKLASDSRTYFLYPNSGSGKIEDVNNSAANYNTINENGAFVQGNCNSTKYPALPFDQSTQRFCNAQISGLPRAAQYYVHISSVYKDSSVSIQGTDAGGSVKLLGAEAVVDVTGEGNDVLRRVQARVPFDGGFAYPDNSINSMQTICKRFRLPKTGPGPNEYGPAFSDIGGASDPDRNCFP